MRVDRIDHSAGLKYCGWNMKVIVALPLILPWFFLFCAQAEPSSYVDSDGFQVHRLPSPYQASDTTLRVSFLPDHLDSDGRYRALYVLPVHEDGVRRHGDGLLEVKKYGYHNEHQLILRGSGIYLQALVSPTTISSQTSRTRAICSKRSFLS